MVSRLGLRNCDEEVAGIMVVRGARFERVDLVPVGVVSTNRSEGRSAGGGRSEVDAEERNRRLRGPRTSRRMANAIVIGVNWICSGVSRCWEFGRGLGT